MTRTRVGQIGRRGACWGGVVLALGLLLAAPVNAQDALVDFGDNWKYFRGVEEPSTDGLGNPTTAWREDGFDDTLWESGPTGIGYGDGDDATVLDDMEENLPDTPGYTTVYLRTTFNVPSVAAVSLLALEVDYDDGFVCYINGVEATRANAGAAGTDLPFDATAGGNHEAGTTEPFDLSGVIGNLRNGQNLIAVQGLNTNIGSSDFSLKPRLVANDSSLFCPADLTCISTATAITLSWTNLAADYDEIRVIKNGLALPGSPFPGNTTSADDTNPGNYEHDYEVIAVVDGNPCPALTCSSTARFVLLDEGEDWRYFRGTQAPSIPATAWRGPGFNDAAWELGPSGFGYADGDDNTVLDDMEQIADDPDTPEDESQPGYASVFIRTQFAVPALNLLENVVLEMDYDDGFIAYVNGTEIGRSDNMGTPGQEFAFDDLATGGHEAGTPEQFGIDLGLLQAGNNLIAIQTHNTELDSSDASAIPRILANVCPVLTGVTCSADTETGEVTVSWDNLGLFDTYEVTRDGSPVEGSPFPSDASSFTDANPPPRDSTYEVVGIVDGEVCSSDDCDLECGDVNPDALTCVLRLAGDHTEADLSWTTPPGTQSIDVSREGATIATLGGAETGYTDPDVESDEPEDDTDYEVVFNFAGGETCTISCAAMTLCPENLTCEIVDDGGTPRVQLSWENVVKEWESYTIQLDGVELDVGIPGNSASYLDTTTDLTEGETYTYTLVPVAPLGEELAAGTCDLTCSISVPIPEVARYLAPPGGWDYFLDFSGVDDQYNPVVAEVGNLDGDWIRAADRDSWDGSAPLEVGPAPDGDAPGGIGIEQVIGLGTCGEAIRVLRLLDPGNPTNPGATLSTEYPDPYDEPNNRRLVLGLNTGVSDRNLLQDGVTIAFRARLNPDAPEYLNAGAFGDGDPVSGGLGLVGMHFIDDDDALDDALVGAPAGLAVNLNSGGDYQMTTSPVMELEAQNTLAFTSFWVTVEGGALADTYNVTTYVNGQEMPFVLFGNGADLDLQAGGADFGSPVGNFFVIALNETGNDADVQIDWLAYAEGVHAPVTELCAPCDNSRPVVDIEASATTVALSGGSATVDLDGSGSRDDDGDNLRYQWSKLSGPAGESFSNPTGATTDVTFVATGVYRIQLLVDDRQTCNNTASASVTITVTGGGQILFRRGDTDTSGTAQITDAIAIFGFLFLGEEEPDCLDAADVDDNGQVQITDGINLLNFLFLGGIDPMPPGPENCGPDPSPDGLAPCVYDC